MKIRSVSHNNRRKVFEVRAAGKTYVLPFARVRPTPSRVDPVADLAVDHEVAREAFTYTLRSGATGTVHIDQVLEYNRDPGYLRDQLLYRLTVEANRRVEQSALSKREIIRRLGTSATQFYRLVDPTNYRKSVDQLVALLQVLDYEVDLRIRPRPVSKHRAA